MSYSVPGMSYAFITVLHTICEDFDKDEEHFPLLADFDSILAFTKLKALTTPEKWTNRKLQTDFENLLEFIRSDVGNHCKREMPLLWVQIQNLLKQFAEVTHEPEVKKEETVVKRQTKMNPIVAKQISPVEYEVISDEEENPTIIDDEDEKDPLEEREDSKNHFVTPKLKRARVQTPCAPRVLRRKVIFWKTTDEIVIPDDDDNDDGEN